MTNLTPLLLFLGFELAAFILGIKVHPMLMIGVPLSIILFWWMIRHPEINILLLMFTGVVKGYILEMIPAAEVVDLTVLLVLMVWLGLVKHLLKGSLSINNSLVQIVTLFIMFTLFVLFSAFYTPSVHYGWLKAGRFILITLTMVISPLVFLKTYKDSLFTARMFRVFIGIMVILFMIKLTYIVLTGGLLGYIVRVTFAGINPIGPARIMSIGAGIALVYMFHLKNQVNWKYGLVVLLMILGTITTGSRGPLMSFFIGGGLYVFLFEPSHRKRLLIYSVLVIGIISVFLLLLPENLTYRFLNISTSDYIVTQTGVKRYSTIASRLDFWSMSYHTWISSFKNFLFGLGSGGFSSLFIWRDFRWYPHNFIFEVLVEFGLVGVGLLFSYILKSWLFIRKEKSWSKESKIWIVSTLIMFFAALISGDINDNRILWTLISLTLASVTIETYNRKHVQVVS